MVFRLFISLRVIDYFNVDLDKIALRIQGQIFLIFSANPRFILLDIEIVIFILHEGFYENLGLIAHHGVISY